MGQKLERRAIQLGLRGEILQNYSRDWIIKIEDITEFVQQQRSNRESNKWINLITPTENVAPVDNSEIIVDKNIVKYDIFLFCKFYLDWVNYNNLYPIVKDKRELLFLFLFFNYLPDSISAWS